MAILTAKSYNYREMAGFLHKARRARDEDPESRSPFEDDETRLLPEGERREILSEIDRIAADNKILVTPQTFTVPAKRGGARFPILVNVIALLILTGGVWGMFQLFQQEEQAARSGAGITLTAESRLISELRRQTEAELDAKEDEIAAIRAQLEEVQAERIALQDEIDRRVHELERELRQQLDAEIEAERERLIREGLSEEEIEQLLRDFERRRIAELRAEVEAYRARLEREQQQREQQLAVMEIELSAGLDQARREQTALLEEARRRESDLRVRYEERIARQSEQVALAQQQLVALEEQRQNEVMVQNQIDGFYERIRAAISVADYQLAIETIDRFRNFLDQESVRRLPMIQQRRASELHILETLTRLVRPQVEMQTRDTSELLTQAQRLAEVTNLLERAEIARAEGDAQLAVALAEEAFALLPHGGDAVQLLAERRRAQSDDLRRALLQTRIEEADRALAQDDPQRAMVLFEQALLEAVDLNGEYASVVSRIGDGIRAIAEQELGAQFAAELSAELAAVETATRREFEAALQARIAQLEQQHGRRSAEYQQQIALLEAELQGAREAQQAAEEHRDAAPDMATTEDSDDTRVAVDPALLEELQRLRRLEGELERLRTAYNRYRENEDRVLAGGDDPLAIVEGKLLLDSFLRSPEVQAFFPELAGRIRRYDDAFRETGRRAALLDTMDIVYTLSGYRDAATRQDYLLQERSRTTDPELTEFLDELYTLVAGF